MQSYTCTASSLPPMSIPILSSRPTLTTSAEGRSRLTRSTVSSCTPMRIPLSPKLPVASPGSPARLKGDVPNIEATACTGAPPRCAGISMFCSVEPTTSAPDVSRPTDWISSALSPAPASGSTCTSMPARVYAPPRSATARPANCALMK
eukprot:scaffold82672_cov75-Phaeocystis_antarctica.AAC.3